VTRVDKLIANVNEQLNGLSVDLVQRLLVEAEQRTPIGIGPPGGGFEQEPNVGLCRDGRVGCEVRP